MIRFRSLLALAALFVASTAALSAQESGIAVGATPPAVTAVETLDGKPTTLAAFIGKQPVLIEFWATWCSNCKELEPTLIAAQKKYGKRVAFVGVAVSANQSPERVRRYIAAHPMAMTHFYDKKGDAVEAFDVPATSYVVVLDKAGKVVYTGLGGKQNLDAAIAKAF